MSDLKMDPKLESIKTSAVEFVSHERQSFSEFGEKILNDVEGLVGASVNSASTRLNSMFRKIEAVIKTEPLVAITALAITGLAVANIMMKRSQRRSAGHADSSEAAEKEVETTIH
jgi:hypothetical protein